MKTYSKKVALLCLLALLTTGFCQLRAEGNLFYSGTLNIFINFNMTALVQGSTSVSGSIVTNQSPFTAKITTKTILDQLALDHTKTYPPGARLMINGTNQNFQVVTKDGVFVDDVSDIMWADYFGDTYGQYFSSDIWVLNGKFNTNQRANLPSSTARGLILFVFDDRKTSVGSVQIQPLSDFQGFHAWEVVALMEFTLTDGKVQNDGNYNTNLTLNSINCTGDGVSGPPKSKYTYSQWDGDSGNGLVITSGNISGNASGVSRIPR
ncbi:MAG: hypothetical protein WCH43_10670 [Verrucomicrobiota bacterium]